MGLNPFEAVRLFVQNAQKQTPSLNPENTAKNMLGDPNIQTPAQALEAMLKTGKIDQRTYDIFKGMV